MNILVLDKSAAQVVELVTTHTRFTEQHRAICDDCRDAYEDFVLEEC